MGAWPHTASYAWLAAGSHVSVSAQQARHHLSRES